MEKRQLSLDKALIFRIDFAILNDNEILPLIWLKSSNSFYPVLLPKCRTKWRLIFRKELGNFLKETRDTARIKGSFSEAKGKVPLFETKEIEDLKALVTSISKYYVIFAVGSIPSHLNKRIEQVKGVVGLNSSENFLTVIAKATQKKEALKISKRIRRILPFCNVEVMPLSRVVRFLGFIPREFSDQETNHTPLLTYFLSQLPIHIRPMSTLKAIKLRRFDKNIPLKLLSLGLKNYSIDYMIDKDKRSIITGSFLIPNLFWMESYSPDSSFDNVIKNDAYGNYLKRAGLDIEFDRKTGRIIAISFSHKGNKEDVLEVIALGEGHYKPKMPKSPIDVNLTLVPDETELINEFHRKLAAIDPDILFLHYGQGYDLPKIFEKNIEFWNPKGLPIKDLRTTPVVSWTLVGRLPKKPSTAFSLAKDLPQKEAVDKDILQKVKKITGKGMIYFMPGRYIVDTFHIAQREVNLPRGKLFHLTDRKLDTLSRFFLGAKKLLSPEQIRIESRTWWGGEELGELVTYCALDALLTYRLGELWIKQYLLYLSFFNLPFELLLHYGRLVNYHWIKHVTFIEILRDDCIPEALSSEESSRYFNKISKNFYQILDKVFMGDT